jgi:hypothetical protein
MQHKGGEPSGRELQPPSELPWSATHLPRTWKENWNVMKNSLWRQGSAGTGSVLFCLDKAHAHTNAACVLASFSFGVCPSCKGKWTIFSNTSLIVSCSQQCPTELPGDRCNNYGNSVQLASSSMQICWTRFRRINDLLSSSLRVPWTKSLVALFAIQCCSHGSLFPTNSLGAWIEAVWTYFVWPHRCDDESSGKKIGECVLFFISMYYNMWAAFVCDGAWKPRKYLSLLVM